MEILLYVLAILSIFLTVWFGTLLGAMIGLVFVGKRQVVARSQFAIVAAPVTYLIWFFLMRGR
jgi:hypothetical protein